MLVQCHLNKQAGHVVCVPGIPATWEADVEGSWSEACLGRNRLVLHIGIKFSPPTKDLWTEMEAALLTQDAALTMVQCYTVQVRPSAEGWKGTLRIPCRDSPQRQLVSKRKVKQQKEEKQTSVHSSMINAMQGGITLGLRCSRDDAHLLKVNTCVQICTPQAVCTRIKISTTATLGSDRGRGEGVLESWKVK
jgi:hypothetical protein